MSNCVSFLLLTFCGWAQAPSDTKPQAAAIQLVKKGMASSFDGSLPKVTLEFFLKSEGEGAPVKWEVNDCGEQARGSGG